MDKLSFLFVALALVGGACDSTENIALGDDYLPLQVGNYWEFKSMHQPGDVIEHREVVSPVNLEGRDYFLVVSTYPTLTPVRKDSVYYRKESNGYVYVARKEHPEENLYRLKVNDGDTWTYTIQDYDTNITVAKTSITVDNHTVSDCQSYSYDVSQMADEEHTVTLAPGVGFIKEYSDAWGNGQLVSSARINGRVVKY